VVLFFPDGVVGSAQRLLGGLGRAPSTSRRAALEGAQPDPLPKGEREASG
jgi:hypothetical protein